MGVVGDDACQAPRFGIDGPSNTVIVGPVPGQVEFL
jgi:hypothetical protein